MKFVTRQSSLTTRLCLHINRISSQKGTHPFAILNSLRFGSRAESPSNFYDEGRPSDIVTTVYSQPSFERTASLEYANGNFNYEDRGAEAKSLYNEVVSEDNTLRPVNLNYEDRGAKSKPLYHEVATQDASRGQYYAQPESATFVSEDRASNPAVNFAVCLKRIRKNSCSAVTDTVPPPSGCSSVCTSRRKH